MSEAERKKRQDYKENRKRWIMIQIIAIALISIIAIGSFVVYDRVNREYYIQYTEEGRVDYEVFLHENDFFEGDSVGADKAYVTSLIKNIEATLKYDLRMDADKVSFDYSYFVTAQVLVTDKNSGKALLSPTETLVEETTKSIDSGNKVSVRETVDVDFVRYNALATSFIETYGAKNSNATLVVTLHVNVLSRCDEFSENGDNSYSVSMNMPLNVVSTSVTTSSSVPTAEKVLACKGALSLNIFKVIGVTSSVLDLILAAILVAFVYMTRNEDINYMIKVQKLVKSYRSFIQEMEGEFNADGYQVIHIKTFVEMLGIRDTIQSPVLMCENADQTKTEFLIPTNTKILYVFEIKVDNYDEIYATDELVEIEEDVIIIEDGIDAEAVAEAIALPDVNIDEIEFVPDEDDEHAAADDEPGVEVVGVVWPEHAHKNKVYRYDPNGEQLEEGDVVLVPTRDKERDRDVIRKAAVAHANHRVEPDYIKYPLKKIIGIVKRRVELALSGDKTDETK